MTVYTYKLVAFNLSLKSTTDLKLLKCKYIICLHTRNIISYNRYKN